MCLVYFIYNPLHIKHNFQPKRIRFTSDVPQSVTTKDKVRNTYDGRVQRGLKENKDTRVKETKHQKCKNHCYVLKTLKKGRCDTKVFL